MLDKVEIHSSSLRFNGTDLECSGNELRPDGTCAKCERVNGRIEAALRSATPTPTDERAKAIVGTLFRNTDASYETLERAVIDRITSALADEREICAKFADREREKSEALWQGVANLPVPNTSAMKVYNGRQLAAREIANDIRARAAIAAEAEQR